MKTKHILKTIGLVSAFFLSSIFIISCDSSGENSEDSSSGGITTELPQNVSELENGGIITINLGDEIINFVITDIDSNLGNATVEDGGESSIINNLTFTYNISSSQSITITDNRLTPENALAEFNQLTGDGGSAQDELNALLANDNDENLDALENAINSVTDTERFGIDDDNDTRVFIIRESIFPISGNQVVNGFLIGSDDDDSHPFGLGELTQAVFGNVDSITYTAP